MPIRHPTITLATMQPSVSSAWIVFVVPFASCGVFAHTRPLMKLSTGHTRLTRSVGVLGVAAFIAGLAGWLPLSWAIVAAAAGGAFAGLSIFSVPPSDQGGDEESDNGGGWGRRPPPEDEPPPPPRHGGALDWEQFDSLRAQWERTPVKLP
jgi:hypothetical protein